MTARSAIAPLDTADATAVVLYERAFYDAFRRATANRLVRKLWLWDDEQQRLATRIPYEDQVVYALRDCAGTIVGGIGVNLAMREFQSSAFGFSPAAWPHAAEILTFFSVIRGDVRATTSLWRCAAAQLRARGCRTALATTAQRPLRSYLRIGWQLIAETEIEAERRYFLRYDLSTSSDY